jgi:hypothetical protein
MAAHDSVLESIAWLTAGVAQVKMRNFNSFGALLKLDVSDAAPVAQRRARDRRLRAAPPYRASRAASTRRLSHLKTEGFG